MKIWLQRYLYLLLVCCCAGPTFAQNQFNQWYFGQGAALDFNSGSPTAVSGCAMFTNEGSASMADPVTGELLFYTDGVTVWERTNVQMVNGFGLSGDVTSTQSALIVQQPGSDSLYYIFTVPADGALTDLRYSIVDMSLSGGFGEVTVKNTFMAAGDTIAEKVTAIRHCNGKDWWVIFHALGNDHYLSWRLDSLGLSGYPVVSAAGTVITTDLNRGLGWLSANNAATKLVLPSYSGGTVDLVDFDNSTGMVANPILLTGFTKAYGTAFSPDDQVLYVTDDMSLAQYDLSSGVAATIQATRVDIVTEANMMRAIRLGPDGKLYVAREWEPYLGMVNFPNALGMACTYNAMGVNLSPGSNSLGLPNTYPLTIANPCDTIIEAVLEGQENGLAFGNVYPQPCSDRLSFEVLGAVPGELQIALLDIHGRKVDSRSIAASSSSGQYVVSVGHLAAGVYILRVSDGESVAMRRILKE